MFTISDQHIDYILNDIKLRGVEMEDLQLNLLDHICCIMEREFNPGDDFLAAYQKTIPRFFKHELREIEEEAILLLTFKNYYTMKKAMIFSGGFSVFTFITGSFFKVMHWPGANVMLVLAMTSVSLVFLPLLFILKTRETGNTRDKIVLTMGTLIGMMFCIGTLFKVQHWPGANILWFSSVGLSFLVFIPFYFFSGIRKPETKINTIVSTVLLVMVTGIQFTLMNTRPNHRLVEVKAHAYLQNDELLRRMRAGFRDTATSADAQLAAEIQQLCEQMKELILTTTVGVKSLPANFEEQNIHVEEGNLGDVFFRNGEGVKLFEDLKKKVAAYNDTVKDSNAHLPIKDSFLAVDGDHIGAFSNLFVLNSITQLQIYLISSEHKLIASADR